MKITIQPKNSNKRLDKFLSELSKTEKEFSGFSRGDFARAIKAEKVLVNNLKVKSSYKLCKDDEIRLDIKEKNEKLIPNPKVKLEIIYEDENIIVVSKPANLQVHPDYKEKSNTLVNGIISKYPEIANLTENSSELSKMRPGIIHRLDKDTSGIIVIARKKKSFDELKMMFKKRKIQKKYLAVVYGTPEEKSEIINKPIARTSNYRRQTIASKKTKTKIREAVTKYKLIKELKNNLSLLEVSPKTGRTHQIRVHLFSIGCPIVGDKLYKSKKLQAARFYKLQARRTSYKLQDLSPVKLRHGVNRHLLHASEINFKLFGKNYNFSAELPEDFNYFLK